MSDTTAGYPSADPDDHPPPPGPAIFDPVVILNRERVYIAPTARIDSFVKIEGGEGGVISDYVHIASFCHILGGGEFVLAPGASMGSGAKLITGSNLPGNGHGCSAIAPDAKVKRSFVIVERNATLFANAAVLPGVTIGENAVVAAGAVVTRDVPAGELWGGVPARFIKRVDGSPREVSPAPAFTEAEISARWLESMDELRGGDGLK